MFFNSPKGTAKSCFVVLFLIRNSMGFISTIKNNWYKKTRQVSKPGGFNCIKKATSIQPNPVQ